MSQVQLLRFFPVAASSSSLKLIRRPCACTLVRSQAITDGEIAVARYRIEDAKGPPRNGGSRDELGIFTADFGPGVGAWHGF